ncbi:Autophagy protein 29 [Trapelia coarctata]|nr:Autophagy protein 29 [Trapelia coarctata]
MGPSSQPKTAEVHYTVFVRVPFPRGDFVDPPAVHWDSSKDRALWKILSSSSKDAEIDWHALAEEFDVTLPFLLQQAAWLYERQLSQVREQLRKVNQPTSSRGSPAPVSASGSTTVGDQAMRRAHESRPRYLCVPEIIPLCKAEGLGLLYRLEPLPTPERAQPT